MNRLDKWRGCFVISVFVILLLSSITKFISISQSIRILQFRDPVLAPLLIKHSTAAAAIIELAVAVYMIMKRKQIVSLSICSWLVFVIVCYRWLDKTPFTRKYCNCFGGLLSWLGLPDYYERAIPIALLIYMGSGCVIFMIANIFSDKNEVIENQSGIH